MQQAVPPMAELVAPAGWRTVDFLADLHLEPGQPATLQALRQYLESTPADAVFLLGDLFEVWVGDDAIDEPDSFEGACSALLRAAGARHRPMFFMRGNRDFLVGADFLARCGVHDLAEPTMLSFQQHACLLTHGDLLCTDDVAYQQFRRQVRTPEWQAAFLARPLAERQAMARQMREHSEAHHAAQGVYAHIDAELGELQLRPRRQQHRQISLDTEPDSATAGGYKEKTRHRRRTPRIRYQPVAMD